MWVMHRPRLPRHALAQMEIDIEEMAKNEELEWQDVVRGDPSTDKDAKARLGAAKKKLMKQRGKKNKKSAMAKILGRNMQLEESESKTELSTGKK